MSGDIRRSLDVLLEPGQVAELRIMYTTKGTQSGYFSDFDQLERVALSRNGKVPGIYVTLNPVHPDLQARANNRLKDYVRVTTSDDQILTRRWIPIDFDPVRPAGISATDAEHAAAIHRAEDCLAWLTGTLGWPAGVFGDSGNGGHGLFRVDLPNDDTSRDLIQRCLEALTLQFSDQAIAVDLTTFNAARIWKLYGTAACKGDATTDRPHRLSKLLSVPSEIEIVSREQLEALAARLPTRQPRQTRPRQPEQEFDLARWISLHNLPVVRAGGWQGGYKWILNPCPWNPDHHNRAAYIVQFPSGAIAAGCHHHGCAGNDWPALRALVGDAPNHRHLQATSVRSPADPPAKKDKQKTPA